MVVRGSAQYGQTAFVHRIGPIPIVSGEPMFIMFHGRHSHYNKGLKWHIRLIRANYLKIQKSAFSVYFVKYSVLTLQRVKTRRLSRSWSDNNGRPSPSGSINPDPIVASRYVVCKIKNRVNICHVTTAFLQGDT
jgi:hypothetical protein